MKEYWEILKNYKKYIFASPLLIIIFVICDTIQPTLMAIIVDDGVMKKDLSTILHIGLIMVIFSVVAILANIANVYCSSKASVGFATDLRKKMFHKIQQFSFADIDSFSTASLITRMTNDATILQQVLMMSMRLLLRAPLMMLFAFFFVVRIAPQMAWIIGISIPILGICIYFLLKRGIPLFTQVQQKLDKLNYIVRENLINIRVVKTFVREDFEKQKFRLSNDDLCNTVIKASNIVVTIIPVMQFVMNLSIVAIFWNGGKLIVARELQVGELISFINYISMILMALMLVSMTLMMFARATASSKRILEVLHKKPSLKDTSVGLTSNYKIKKGDITFRNVYFKYNIDGENFVLNNLNFHINSGELIAIIGATGAAKSTLLQLIPRLYDVTKGHILIDGRDVKDYSLKELRNSAGMVLQNNELFTGTILSNLKWGNPEASVEDVIKMSKIAEAHDFIMSFANGYDTTLGQGGVNISGGQKQRICLARALLKHPKILILDDSTSAIDTSTEKRIRSNLKQAMQDITILTVTQRINSIQSSDKIIVIEDGKISAIGKHEELLKTSTIYQEIYNSQQIVL